MTVWISQMLCPARHCALAAAWLDDESHPKTAAEQLRASAALLGQGDLCGICGGRLSIEHARTRFATMAEALPELRASERRNPETRRRLDALGVTRERLNPRAGSAGATLDELRRLIDR